MRLSLVRSLVFALLAGAPVAAPLAAHAQGGVNSWPIAEQEAAVKTPLAVDRLAQLERAFTALAALAKRDPSFCTWLANTGDATSIAQEVATLNVHKGVRAALAGASMAPRDFVEVSLALAMAGMAHEARASGMRPPQPVPPAASVAFYAANQQRVDRVLELDPC
ncbi:MAG: hypothetical protein IPF87_24260 [Gemmatimonadetes bacterium]|nr:hypothetical protein [Gemmatimonadota bacterium]